MLPSYLYFLCLCRHDFVLMEIYDDDVHQISSKLLHSNTCRKEQMLLDEKHCTFPGLVHRNVTVLRTSFIHQAAGTFLFLRSFFFSAASAISLLVPCAVACTASRLPSVHTLQPQALVRYRSGNNVAVTVVQNKWWYFFRSVPSHWLCQSAAMMYVKKEIMWKFFILLSVCKSFKTGLVFPVGLFSVVAPMSLPAELHISHPIKKIKTFFLNIKNLQVHMAASLHGSDIKDHYFWCIFGQRCQLGGRRPAARRND